MCLRFSLIKYLIRVTTIRSRSIRPGIGGCRLVHKESGHEPRNRSNECVP
jgi:hypothetical protein